MKQTALIMAAAGFAMSAAGQTAAPAQQPLARAETSFDFVVHASYAEAAPLFGPEGERAWAGKHWDPQFLYPQPAHDEQGAVFTIHHGNVDAVWVNTALDLVGRHFQYVYFIPGLMVTTIDVRFAPIDAGTTKVHVVYTRTAITPEGNAHVAAMSAGDGTAGADWEASIAAYLATQKPAKP